MDEIIDLEQDISRQSALVELEKSHGWKILKDQIKTDQEIATRVLLASKDLEEIRRMQERYNAFSILLQTVEGASNLLAMYNQNLADILEEQKISREYSLD